MSHKICNAATSTMPEIKCAGSNTMQDKILKVPKPVPLTEEEQADKLLKWQADYQKKNPKASLRNVKRAAAKHFGINLK